jgi:hypothetical protein
VGRWSSVGTRIGAGEPDPSCEKFLSFCRKIVTHLYLPDKQANGLHQAQGGVDPDHFLLRINSDFSRRMPSGDSPVACMCGWAAATSLILFLGDKDQIIVISRCWIISEISINLYFAKTSLLQH